MSASRVAFVPARLGSERLPMKNLALVAGRPLLAWAVRAARASGCFERVVVNADHEVFGAVARREGADFYLRPAALGSSQARSDDVVLDFLDHCRADVAAWVNPTNPLQTAEELRAAVEHFEREALDSLVTVERRPAHAVCAGRPVNFEPDGKFERTQDLTPVEVFAYSLMMWRAGPFRRAMAERGHALMGGRFGTFPVSREAALAVKTEADLLLADRWLRTRGGPAPVLRYDPAARAAAAGRGACPSTS